MLTLVSSVPTITFVTNNNNWNLAFASSDDNGGSSSDDNGGSSSDDNGGSSSDDNGGSSSDDNGGSSSDDNGGSSSDDNGGSSSDDNGGSSSDDNGGSATSPPTTDNSDNSPIVTTDNTATSPQTCPDGSTPTSNGMCPSPAVDCNATPVDPTCATTTTEPAEQNFAPNTLTQPRCPLLPTDANGNCQEGDIQGVDPGLSPRLGLPQQQAHYDLPVGNLTQVAKLPDGSCPPGALLTTQEVCVKSPVLPGDTTGSGGGFIQMFPGAPPK